MNWSFLCAEEEEAVELTSSYKPVNWNYYKLDEFEISQSLIMILVVIHSPQI
jgi:hypothetical protein